MGTLLGVLIAVSVLIGLFSYFTNAGLGDRKPREPSKPHSAEDEPPPSR